MGVQSVVPRMMTFNCKEDDVNDENTKHGNIGRHVNSVVLFRKEERIAGQRILFFSNIIVCEVPN